MVIKIDWYYNEAARARLFSAATADEPDGERAQDVYEGLDVSEYHTSVERALAGLEAEADEGVGPAGKPASAD